MPVPTTYIFTKGTCTKAELFDVMINALKNAGWKDISSKHETDFIVLNSKGNTGDKNLLLNLRDTDNNNHNSISTTGYCMMSYRLQNSYIPGENGASGVFGRPSLGWTYLYIVPNSSGSMDLQTQITYYIYADASKLMLMLTYPRATSYFPIFIYLGLPDTNYIEEPDSRGIILATSAYAIANSCIYIADSVKDLASLFAPYQLNTYSLLPPMDPNANDKSFLSSVYYGSVTEGFRGKLDGVKLVYFSGSNFITGDTITVGSAVYTVFITATANNSSFSSRGIAIRTA